MQSIKSVSTIAIGCLAFVAILHSGYNSNYFPSLRNLLSPFGDTFPDKFKAFTMIGLSYHIYDIVEGGGNFVEALSILDVTPHYYYEGPSSTEALIVTSNNEVDKYVALVFRGTEDATDAVVDADVFQDPMPAITVPDDVYVHSGFKRVLYDDVYGEDTNETMLSYQKIEQELMKVVNDETFNLNGEIYITGHSLGGALAQLFGAYLATQYPDKQFTMITFGQPRVGNDGFKNWAESLDNFAQWRAVNEDDPVPRGPANTMNYYHAGHLIQLEEDETIFYYEQDGEGDYAGAPGTWSYGFNFFDHSSVNYMAKMDVCAHGDSDSYWSENFEMVEISCPWYNPYC